MSSTVLSSTQDLNKQLSEACSNQNLCLIKKLLSDGADASLVYKEDGTWGAYEKYSVLHLAIKSLPRPKPSEEQKETWKEIILALLRNGANPNETKESYDWRGCGSKRTAFEVLKYVSNPPSAQLLSAFLESGLDPNLAETRSIHSMRTDGFIKTHFLHDFSLHGNIECAIAVLNAGADVDIRAIEDTQNERGYKEEKSETALHMAASNNQIQMCLILLAKGADIDAIEYHLDAKIMKEIADKNTTDDPRDEAYKNPWKITPVECTSLHLSIINNHFDLAKLLLLCGADVSIPYKRSTSESISTLDLFQSQTAKEEALLFALKDKLDISTCIQSLSRETREKISEAFAMIQDQGWNFDTHNFPDINKCLTD